MDLGIQNKVFISMGWSSMPEARHRDSLKSLMIKPGRLLLN